MTGVQFEINVIDNMSAVLDELAERTEGIHQTYGNAEAAAEQLREAQEKVKDSTNEVSDALMKQQINAIGAMTAINTLSSGVRMLSYSILRLDMVSEENRKTVMKLVAAFQLVAGAVSIVKAVTLATEALGLASLKVASVKAFTTALDNPLKVALIGGALAGVGVLGGYALAGGFSKSSSSTTETNLNIYYSEPSSDQDANSNVINQVLRGGRI